MTYSYELVHTPIYLSREERMYASFESQIKTKMETKELFAVLLKQERFIIVPRKWIENPSISKNVTEVFYSADSEDSSDFNSEIKYFFNPNHKACYEAYAIRKFDDCQQAENYIEWKRPVFSAVHSKSDASVEYLEIRNDDLGDSVNEEVWTV